MAVIQIAPGAPAAQIGPECEIDCLGAAEGDTLIFNMATGRFEPLGQAGVSARNAFKAAISALLSSGPTTQLP